MERHVVCNTWQFSFLFLFSWFSSLSFFFFFILPNCHHLLLIARSHSKNNNHNVANRLCSKQKFILLTKKKETNQIKSNSCISTFLRTIVVWTGFLLFFLVSSLVQYTSNQPAATAELKEANLNFSRHTILKLKIAWNRVPLVWGGIFRVLYETTVNLIRCIFLLTKKMPQRKLLLSVGIWVCVCVSVRVCVCVARQMCFKQKICSLKNSNRK